jgi:hypothetical protein
MHEVRRDHRRTTGGSAMTLPEKEHPARRQDPAGCGTHKRNQTNFMIDQQADENPSIFMLNTKTQLPLRKGT